MCSKKIQILDNLNNLINDIQSVLNPLQYSCDRYVLIDPRGKIRHSTKLYHRCPQFFIIKI